MIMAFHGRSIENSQKAIITMAFHELSVESPWKAMVIVVAELHDQSFHGRYIES